MKGRVTTLSVSCETADPAALRDRVCKRLDPADIERVAESAARHGVPLMVHFIIGFPYETAEDIRQTIDFAYSCGLDYVFFFIAKPYAGGHKRYHYAHL